MHNNVLVLLSSFQGYFFFQQLNIKPNPSTVSSWMYRHKCFSVGSGGRRRGENLEVRSLVRTQMRLAYKWCSEMKRQRVPRDEAATLDATAAPAPDFIRGSSGWIIKLWSPFNRGSPGAGCHGYPVLMDTTCFVFLFFFFTVIEVASMTAQTKQTRDFKTSWLIWLRTEKKSRVSAANIQAFVSLMEKKNNWIDDTEGNPVE